MAIDIHSEYVPLPWQARMHSSSWTHICLAGGKGGGKTRSGLEELKTCALEYPGSTWLIGRKTLPSLKDSTLKEFFKCTPASLIKEYNKTDRNVTLVNGSMFIFRSLDEEKKFDSLEISGFLIDEADEIEQEIYNTLKSRVRQMLPGKVVPRYRSFLILNPCEESHWIPQLFLYNKPKDHEIFNSSTMENQENLPPGYVETLKSTYSPDMQARMIHGIFGKVHKGNPVFPQFKRGDYVRPIEPIVEHPHSKEKYPIFRGWDFGFNHPAIVWFQFINGQCRVLAEKLGNRIYLDDFITKEIFPYQVQLFGKWEKYRDMCDPRGSDESDKGKTSIDILNDFGIYPVYRRTMIEEGIKAMKNLLDTHAEGEPNFLIHSRCKVLIEGFRGGYHREAGADAPYKDGYYDHLFDALRYPIVNLTRRQKFNRMQRTVVNKNRIVHPVTGRIIEW